MQIRIPIEALQLARFAYAGDGRDHMKWLRINSPTPNAMRATTTDGHTLAQWEWECVESVLVDPLYLYAPDVAESLASVPKKVRLMGARLDTEIAGDTDAFSWESDQELFVPVKTSRIGDFPRVDQVMVSRELRQRMGEMGVKLGIDIRKVATLLDWSRAVNRNARFEMTIHEGKTEPVRFDTTAENEPREGNGTFLIMPCHL